MATYKLIFIPVTVSGELSMESSGIKMFMRTNVVVQSGRPQFLLEECWLQIRDLNFRLHGGLGAWVANHFVSGSEDKIKGSIKNEICNQIRAGVKRLNKELWALSSHVKLTDTMYFNYHLLENPKAATDYIELNAFAYVTFGQAKCYPGTEALIDDKHASDRMAVLWIAESMVNCYLKTWYEVNSKRHVYITASSNDGKFRDFLNTNCTERMRCLGVNVALQSHSIELDIYVVNAPVFRAQTENYSEVNLHIDLYQSHRDPQSPVLAQFAVQLKSLIKARILQRKLIIEVENVTATTSQISSKVGIFDQKVLDGFLKVAETALKELGLWQQVIEIKEVEELPKLALSENATFITRNGYVRADFDFTYA